MTTPNPIKQRREGHILILSIDNPPVNAFSPGVPEGLHAGLDVAEKDSSIEAVVITGSGKSFISGADIRTFNLPRDQAPDLRGFVARLDGFGKPIVAAINGVALGGGLEVTLACHYRVALRGASVGLPEVKLGLLPGAGGTQRLTRLVGPEKALEMMLAGNPISAARAAELGIVDEVVDDDLLTHALEFARQHSGTRPLPRISERQATAPAPEFFAETKAKLAKTHRGQLSPEYIVDLAEMAVTKPFQEGWEAEARLFVQAKDSPQSRGLRHIFFAQRQAAKVAGIDKGTPVRPVNKVGIIGAGTMGSGIAMNFLNAGLPVTLVDTTPEALERGLGTIRRNYEASAAKGRISADDVAKRLGLLSTSLDFADLAAADLIIEAAFESMDVKKDIFTRLDSVAKPGAILASNTSTLDINEIAGVTSRVGDVLGLHFFSPANVMKLLEIVRGDATSLSTLATALEMGRNIGKIGVVVGVCPGFVGNRMLAAYRQQAQYLVLHGAAPQEVDAAMHALGLPMGPFEMGDMAGLDIGYASRREAARKTGTQVQADWTDALVEMGRKGQKTGAGIYDYTQGRTPVPSAVSLKVLEDFRAQQGVTPRPITPQEMTERLVYSLVGEGAQILAEGIAQRSSDIDVVYVYGYGFPAYLGGPMRYASEQGLAEVVQRMKHYGLRVPPLLAGLAAQGKTFSDWDAERGG